MFRAIRSLSKIPKIPDLAALPAPKKVKTEDISLRLRGPIEWGRQEDPLEKAALQGVPGSLPERIVEKWLQDQGYTYEPQSAQMGGKLVSGGSVVDFIVYGLTAQELVLRVQGDYWHGPQFPERRARDDEQFWRLTRMGFKVVDLWESDIYEAVLRDRLTAYIEEEVFA